MKKSSRFKEPVKTTVRIPVQLYLDVQEIAETDHRTVGKELVYLAELGLAAIQGKHIQVVKSDGEEVEESSAIGFQVDN